MESPELITPLFRRSVRLLFWGMGFLFFFFRINELDLFPDFIGYVVIAVACGRLIQVSPEFHAARSLAVICSVAWFARFTPLAYEIGLALLVLQLILIWFVLGELARTVSRFGHAETTRVILRWRGVYAVADVSLVLLSYADAGLATPVFLLWLVIAVRVLVLLRQVAALPRVYDAHHADV